MLEQTLSIIKPDAVERNLDNKIKVFFEKAIPAISKCAQGVLFVINLCKNWAAVMEPAPPA